MIERQDNREFVYELKFFVGAAEAAALKDWVRLRLRPDPYGGGTHGDYYHVSTVYFDTPDFHVLARQGSYARAKYRVRRYGAGETVYLERKTKGSRRVSKRRSATPLAHLPRLENGATALEWNGHWFHRRLLVRSLRAVCRVDYLRLARVEESDFGPIRLTLDQELRAWRARSICFDSLHDGVALTRARLIIELKFGHSMPLLFKQLIRDFALETAGVSKFRLACAALGLTGPGAARLPYGAREIAQPLLLREQAQG
jgi:VTC domain